MGQDIAFKQRNYERASRLLGELFEVNSDITGQINCCIQQCGAGRFFKNLETFDFSEDILKKLKAVRMVLFGIGEETAIKDMLENTSDIRKPESTKDGAKL